jgi:cytochrome c oxidase cbb3-type subunit I/II
VGMVMAVYNLVKTMKQGKLQAEEPAEAPAIERDEKLAEKISHRWLERKPIQFLILTTVAVAIGGIVEIVPTYLIKSNIPTISAVKPYTPLEVQGRDIYIREGCNTCHSQVVRPFRSETERYGEYSKAGEYVYDHPFLWGSKRTGPDLARVGGKYPDAWHYMHMKDPTSMSPGSIMPSFQWLITNAIDTSSTMSKIRALQAVGVPYTPIGDNWPNGNLMTQANAISQSLKASNIECPPDREIIALTAYLQRLGTDIKPKADTAQVTATGAK